MSKQWLCSVVTTACVLATTPLGADTLKVVTDPSFVPFEMMDPATGRMTGFDMDILAAVAARAGFDYSVSTMDFNGIIPSLQTGNVDLAIAGITITAERRAIIDFSTPYYDSGLRILVREDDDRVHRIDDLEGLLVGTKLGSTSYDFLLSELGDSHGVVAYPDSHEMFNALMAGDVDAVLFDAPNVGFFARNRGEGHVKTVGPLYQGQQYGIAFRKDSDWLHEVNSALEEIRRDGTYRAIYEKWFDSLPEGR
ncbi:transporter substrate-binding domain-containing protein [Marinobacter zhejiangensis]|uniref:Amino acid ABC transporter substrate-binding protein, PAAT family (TC 3.A.1.3.-) n=1 Tax=Marinobacter zhejiangensis TaxID=488535 RepID=A0A1I4SUT5_9GAMM|nr:transporter substrate-binding domain-containing protein [Marinobacter zhejiangensis]SFM68147.1 amino acid ABC transporter substrate-binding protein, PAAT family (TC 3.A.1.3.-) [Marinobacter zhejiangensis]